MGIIQIFICYGLLCRSLDNKYIDGTLQYGDQSHYDPMKKMLELIKSPEAMQSWIAKHIAPFDNRATYNAYYEYKNYPEILGSLKRIL